MKHVKFAITPTTLAIVATSLILAASAATYADARELTFGERVKAQQAIEQIYWNHRIWPKENPGPKPPLSAVMPDSAIRAKVEAYLRSSALLDSYWHRPLTGEQLQAEIDRVVRTTKSPGMLRELFAALNDDPLLIAECLARPTLSQARVEAAFEGEKRIHGAQRARLASMLAEVKDLPALERVSGDHTEMTYVLDESPNRALPRASDRAIHLNREEWDRLNRSLATDGVATLPLRRASQLLERGDSFVVLALRARTEMSATIVSVSWPKRAYAEWALEQAPSSAPAGGAISPPKQGYSASALVLDSCTDDTWAPISGSEVPEGSSPHAVVWTGSEMIVWGGRVPSGGWLRTGGRYDPATDSWIVSSLNTGGGANVPYRRFDHTAIWTGSEMIVWGGYVGDPLIDGVTNTGGRYNPATDSWIASSLDNGTGANVPEARDQHTAVWTGSEMIVWGGEDAHANSFNTGGRYNPSTDSWAVSSLTYGTGANVPAARCLHTAVWTASEMIIWGGHVQTPTALVHNTGGRYNPSTDSWVSSSLTTGSGANVPAGRYDHTAVWTGSEMIIWGGDGGGPIFKTGGRYSPSADSWVASSLTTGSGANVPAARTGHSAVWTGLEMIVWGGSGLNTGGRYSPSTDAWAASSLNAGLGGFVPAGRTGHSAVWTGSEMIVWGGSGPNTGGRFNPSTDSWDFTGLIYGPRENVPAARGNHTAVWTGVEMIVWGGYAGAPFDYGVTNTGGLYKPAFDVWIPSTLTVGCCANAPTGRNTHTAVWTGSEMIVWGGITGNQYLRTGGRFNPSMDNWVPTSLLTGSGANVPGARYQHTAVWTGTEMIVWGGSGDGGSLNTGGRYNPSTDSWAASSLTTGSGANVPTVRLLHKAVWTGTEMIVWGGKNGGLNLNTGGRYNPSTDSWVASSLTTGSGANVPAARAGNSTVWTGSEMVVWGGSTATLFLNTGGRYNPSTDSWVASSLTTGSGANVPAARSLHSAVWTGNKMIVWGGFNFDADGQHLLNTGGRYDPSTDLWTPSSLTTGSGAYVPAARDNHSSVWTGSSDLRMTVWGGDAGGFVHSGGLYCALACTPQTWYRDVDGDGHGNAAVTQSSCTQPPGYVATGDDCDETNSHIHPGAPELCDGIDNNCNHQIDEALDTDGDGRSDCQDNCPGISNPTQADADADGIGDPCDCWPSNASNPPPPEVSILQVTGKQPTSIAWPTSAANVRYNVYRGYRISGSAASGYQCAASQLTTPPTSDLLAPRPSESFYYLVSAVCPNGAESALGRDSHGAPIGVPALIADRCPNPITDGDGDGTVEAFDNCPGVPNGSQLDTDGDSHGDVCDNCPSVANTDQMDQNGNGVGDACDADRDGDGIPNASDNCPDTPNPTQADADGNGIGDACQA